MASIYDAERKARSTADRFRLVPPVTALFAGLVFGGRLGPAGDPQSAADRFCLVPPVTALFAGFGFGREARAGRRSPAWRSPAWRSPRHGGGRARRRPGMAVVSP